VPQCRFAKCPQTRARLRAQLPHQDPESEGKRNRHRDPDHDFTPWKVLCAK
jgi:hypothetical protein